MPILRKLRSLYLGSVFMALSAAPLSAQQATTTIRIADFLPPTHFVVQSGLKPWMEEIESRSKGAIKFEHFPAQQIGKVSAFLTLVQSNVAQIGYAGVTYVADKMILSDVAQLPGMFESACEGSRAYQTMARSRTIATEDFDRNGVRFLYAAVFNPYQVFTRSHPLRSIDDFKGLKLRTTGEAMNLLARNLNAVPINISGPEVYEALHRGTIDGLVFPYESLIAHDVVSLVKHGTMNSSFGSFVGVYFISKKVWNALTPEIQAIIDDASSKAAQRVCSTIDTNADAAIQKLMSNGVSLVDLPSAAKAVIRAMSEKGAQSWAAKLDQRKRPGSKVLAEFRAELGKPDEK